MNIDRIKSEKYPLKFNIEIIKSYIEKIKDPEEAVLILNEIKSAYHFHQENGTLPLDNWEFAHLEEYAFKSLKKGKDFFFDEIDKLILEKSGEEFKKEESLDETKKEEDSLDRTNGVKLDAVLSYFCKNNIIRENRTILLKDLCDPKKSKKTQNWKDSDWKLYILIDVLKELGYLELDDNIEEIICNNFLYKNKKFDKNRLKQNYQRAIGKNKGPSIHACNDYNTDINTCLNKLGINYQHSFHS